MAFSPSPLDIEDASADRFTSRARPAFLYVMYALLLGAFPMAGIAAVAPVMAAAMTRAIAAYLDAIPEPLYALFGTGYLGYTVVREWGKAKAPRS
ncbi:3TM-type holin [Sphingomonas oryzagri]|uniref:3TM-type holin n=1 Tax=Sphingomonas oryzagri TaxID=3042314 RepID=A0ABT6N6U5_9SPHN|nr:3TM-type holin [Sphingomonas oryzagri]MDH7640816.1 3TM-type holin [Sphingomonas oryzagri]